MHPLLLGSSRVSDRFQEKVALTCLLSVLKIISSEQHYFVISLLSFLARLYAFTHECKKDAFNARSILIK